MVEPNHPRVNWPLTKKRCHSGDFQAKAQSPLAAAARAVVDTCLTYLLYSTTANPSSDEMMLRALQCCLTNAFLCLALNFVRLLLASTSQFLLLGTTAKIAFWLKDRFYINWSFFTTLQLHIGRDIFDRPGLADGAPMPLDTWPWFRPMFLKRSHRADARVIYLFLAEHRIFWNSVS